jgi:hypothetical protein
MECTKEVIRYPDGTVKETYTVKESMPENISNAVSNFVDNTAKTLRNQPINTTKRLPGG